MKLNLTSLTTSIGGLSAQILHSIAKRPWIKFITRRLYLYALLVRLDKPIGILLLLWPTLWALWWAAGGMPDVKVLLVFILGTILMRSAGCAINDFADRNFDKHVARTRTRPVTSGQIKPFEAVLVFLLLSILAFLLVLSLNRYTIYLSAGGLVLAAVYPYSKRYTYLPQVFLGAAFAWGVPMAWAAQTGEVTKTTWLVYTAAVIWAVIYDTQYAMVDRDDDLKVGLKSTAILFAEYDRIIIAGLQVFMLIALIIIGRQMQMGIYYYLSLALAMTFFDHQYWLIRNREPSLCFRAFLNNHWFGMCVFIGIASHYFFL